MNDFNIWFSLGIEHILNLGGYDHILFIVLLVFAFPFREWKKLVGLILGFTIGHSLSMALSVLTRFQIPTAFIELCIALTILFSALWELFTMRKQQTKAFQILLGMVTLFGLIHGLGFSLSLRSLLSDHDNFILPLLYFNLGIELAQLIIVVAVTVFSVFLTALIKIPTQYFKITIVCIIGIIAFLVSAERLSQLLSS